MTAEGLQRLRRRVSLSGRQDVALEVRQAAESWLNCFTRVIEHLRADVAVVLLADAVSASVSVFRPRQRPEAFEKNQTLTIPDVLPGFEVPVARFFEE